MLNHCMHRLSSIKLLKHLGASIPMIALIPAMLLAQQDVTKSYLRRLDYYKYANISIFEANAEAIKRFREEFTPTPQKTPALEQAEQDCPTTDEIKKKLKNKQPVAKSLLEEAQNECEMVLTYYKILNEQQSIGKVYVITEKYVDGSDPVIIGAISIQVVNPAQAGDPEAIKTALNAPINSGVLDANELRALKTKVMEQSNDPNNPGSVFIRGSIESTPYDNMLEYFKNSIKQSPLDKINTIRPQQTAAIKISKDVVSKMLSEDRVGDYMYITEGEPHKVNPPKEFLDEIVIGLADYFSWKHYADPQTIEGDPTGLPQYGIEMKAGVDDIGFPSLWSERWTLHALWGQQKLGVVLPTSLWAGEAKIFNDRKMTSGAAGLSAAFDFPFKLIDRSGIFNVSGSYCFSNNENITKTDYGTLVDPTKAESGRYDYFLKSHAQANYTFAIQINDPDKEEQLYFIRFKIGGAFYLMETFLNTKESFQKLEQKAIGGFLTRLEFMATGLSVPFGTSAQFFDGALSGHVWLQVPISEEGFFTGIRLDGKIYAPVTRSPYNWELQTVIMPSLRFIFRW